MKPTLWVVRDEDGEVVSVWNSYTEAFAGCTKNDSIQGFSPSTTRVPADVSKVPEFDLNNAISSAISYLRAEVDGKRRPSPRLTRALERLLSTQPQPSERVDDAADGEEG